MKKQIRDSQMHFDLEMKTESVSQKQRAKNDSVSLKQTAKANLELLKNINALKMKKLENQKISNITSPSNNKSLLKDIKSPHRRELNACTRSCDEFPKVT